MISVKVISAVRQQSGNGERRILRSKLDSGTLLHRHSGLKQHMIGERCGDLDEGLVSRNRRAIRKQIESEPKTRKWFQDLATLSA
jgi:hypothetical protein